MTNQEVQNFVNLVGKDGVNFNVKLDREDLLLLLAGVFGSVVIGGLIVVMVYRAAK